LRMRRSKGGRGERLSSGKNTQKGKATCGVSYVAPMLAAIYPIEVASVDEVTLPTRLGRGG
jgi:hypothetical protein